MKAIKITLSLFFLLMLSAPVWAGSPVPGMTDLSVNADNLSDIEAATSVINIADKGPEYLYRASAMSWGGLIAVIATIALLLFPVIMIRFFPDHLSAFLARQVAS